MYSEQLQIAVDISRKLYPEKPTGIDLDSRTEYYSQRRRIITKLEKEDEKLDKITREALAKIINPVSKKSFTKK